MIKGIIMSESASLPRMDSFDSTLVCRSVRLLLRFWQTVKLPSNWPIAIVQNQIQNIVIPRRFLTWKISLIKIHTYFYFTLK